MTTTKRPTRPPGRRDSRRPPRSVTLSRRPHYWFAHRLLLVLSGQRPVHSLLGHTSGPAYDQLSLLAPRAPLRPAPAAARPSPTPVLGHVGFATPRPGAIEAYARICVGERTRALAFRLEHGQDRRWRCAAVELDIRPDPAPVG